MSENHKKFLSHLSESQNSVWLIAKFLNSFGYNVTVNASDKAKEAKDWQSFVDNGDLMIQQRVEVKALSAEFTNSNDWKFGKKFIVCAKHSFDNATPKPYLYIYLNKQKTHAAFVLSDTFSRWYVETRRDSRYNNVEQEFYFCPLENVVFSEIANAP
jgi:hypothetical protein